MIAFALAQPVPGCDVKETLSTGFPARQPPLCFNRRAEAARRRWQDPEYRKKMLAARASNVLSTRKCFIPRKSNSIDKNTASSFSVDGDGLAVKDVTTAFDGTRPLSEKVTQTPAEQLPGVIEIGAGDSLTLCSEEKAAAINAYVIRNKHRSEKLLMFHHDKQRWIDNKLQEGENIRLLMNNVEVKRQRQLQRQQEARKRHARIRARKFQLELVSETNLTQNETTNT